MVVVDEEFKSLIPPLSSEEFQQLEENCLKDGIRDALVVWPQEDGTDILIDGHNRWAILGKHINSLQPQFISIQFEDREAAKEWIIRNQFGRRNLSAYDRSLLALKLKPMIAEKAKDNLHQGNEPLQKSVNPVNTQKELAKVAGVSHDTIHKVEVIQKEASPEAKEALKRGDISINQVYSGIKAKENETRQQEQARELREAKERHEAFENNKSKVVDFEDIEQDLKDSEVIFDDFEKTLSDIGRQMRWLSSLMTDEEFKPLLRTAEKYELTGVENKLSDWFKIIVKARRELEEVRNEK